MRSVLEGRLSRVLSVALGQLRHDSEDPRSEEREDSEGVPRSLELREQRDLHTGRPPGPQVGRGGREELLY